MKSFIFTIIFLLAAPCFGADYHVLNQHEKAHQVTVVFHYTVPDQNNFAGVNLRTACKQWFGSPTTAVPWLETDNPTEFAAIQNGEVYEDGPLTIEYDGNLTKAQKKAIIDAKWTIFNAAFQAKVVNILDFWGYDGTVE